MAQTKQISVDTFFAKSYLIGRTLSVANGVHQNCVWPRKREKLNLSPAPDLIFNVIGVEIKISGRRWERDFVNLRA